LGERSHGTRLAQVFVLWERQQGQFHENPWSKGEKYHEAERIARCSASLYGCAHDCWRRACPAVSQRRAWRRRSYPGTLLLRRVRPRLSKFLLRRRAVLLRRLWQLPPAVP